MSLQFVLGNSGSGKSHFLFEHVIEESIKYPGNEYLVIVPEQFTMQTQKELVTRHPRHGIMNIDVLSFARLAYRIFEETGMETRTVLDDEGKNLILRKIAGKAVPSLKVLGRNIQKPGYISEVKSVISELTQYSISPQGMDAMLDAVPGESRLYYKLKDIQELYRRFEEYLEDKYLTREELMDVLCDALPKSDLMKRSIVVFDGFTGFTPIQFRVLRQMLNVAKKVMVTMTIDRKTDAFVKGDPFELFAMSRETVCTLTDIAGQEHIPIEDTVYLPDDPVYRFRETEALGFLESELFRYGTDHYEKPTNAIRIFCARNPAEEVRIAAQRIRGLVRMRGCRYQEIAVIVADRNVYGDEMEKTFAEYHIPVFMDYKRNVLLNSFVEYIRSLLAMPEKQFSPESVFRFLRTGLTGFTADEVDVLENYVLALGIKGYKNWQNKWIRRGKTTTEQELESLNGMRVRFVEMLDELMFVFRQRKKTIRDMTEAVHTFLIQQEIQKKVKQQEEEFAKAGELALAKEYAQIYRVVMELFDKMVVLMGEENLSLKEYASLMDAGFEEARIGVIPPGLDQVVVGDIERTRLKDIRFLLFLGVNDTLLPGTYSSGGLITEKDRERFSDAGIRLAPGAKEKMYIQKFYLYLLMTKPSEELDLFFSKVSGEGKTIRPSYLIADVRKLFPKVKIFDMEEFGLSGAELTPETGISLVIKGLQDRETMTDKTWQELYRWYCKRPEWKEKIDRLVAASLYRKKDDGLSARVAEEMYGEARPGVTRLERFAACAFSHFLTYGLQMREREEYEFAPVDFGNVFHRALERYARKLENAGLSWTTAEEAVRRQFIDESVEESIVDYSNTVLYSSARHAYMIPRMKRMMRRTVWAMTRQLSRGKFTPDGYEINFGSGKIDRIDTMETEEKVYVRIVDYKTGSQSFDMTAFYHGLQLQLVVYMGEALKLEKRKHPGKQVVPAGIFYYRIKDPIVERQEELQKLEQAIMRELRLDGIVNEDENIVELMDEDFTIASEVIPVSKLKSGAYRSTSRTVRTEEFQGLLGYAQTVREELTRQMKQGEVDVNPYEMGDRSACDYCGYKNICGFDERIEGYAYRRIHKMSEDEIFGLIAKDEKESREEKGGQADQWE